MSRCLGGIVIASLMLAGGMAARQSPTSSPRFIGQSQSPTSTLSLWYRAPATEWVRALPVGNGRLGAMVFGGVDNERLQLNEDTLWAGGPYNPVNPEARAALPEVRQLLASAQYREAATLVRQKVMAKPLAQMPYQTVGDLHLKFAATDTVENYRRDLDLTDAVARVSYSNQEVTFAREVFASVPDQVIVVRLTASRPGQISFEARMQTPQRATEEATSDGDLVMRGVNGDGNGVPGALRFESRVRILPTGGTRSAGNNTVTVRNADAVTLLIAAATSYRSYSDVSGALRSSSRTHWSKSPVTTGS
jgi:alpha-L-fucosidase 2